MPARDYAASPISDALGLGRVVTGLVSDLEELRAGKISVNDAIARSLLAKQIFNGMRIYLNGTKLLSESARQIGPAPTPQLHDEPALGESSREAKS